MVVLKSALFNNYPEISFGFSTKIGLDRKEPYNFNMSLSVGDDPIVVKENRKTFFSALGLDEEQMVYQKQVHGDVIRSAEKGGFCGESDALITRNPNLGLVISSADCPAIFIYDPVQKIIAGIHSGWRSSEKKILLKTLSNIKYSFNSRPDDLIAYIAPCISGKNYEVGKEVAEKFDERFIVFLNNKYFLDLSALNYNILLDFGLKEKNIQVSNLCTFENKELLHSYRREGVKSGRALGVIAMKGNC